VSLIPRVVRIGLVAAVGVAVSGWIVERVRFGPSDQTAVAKVEAELRQRIGDAAEALQHTATRVAASPDLMRIDPRDQAQARRLFDLVDAATPDEHDMRAPAEVCLGLPASTRGRIDVGTLDTTTWFCGR